LPDRDTMGVAWVAFQNIRGFARFFGHIGVVVVTPEEIWRFRGICSFIFDTPTYVRDSDAE
jgi:hypothetical protein